MGNNGKELVLHRSGAKTPGEALKSREESAKKGGTLLESKYRQFLEAPDDYSDMYFSAEEAQFIRRKLTYLSTGAFAAIPLVCFEPCSLVVMGDLTVKEIENIEIGDEVISHTGEKRKVSRVFKREYKGEMIRIGFGQNYKSKSFSAWSTPNHEYLVRRVRFSKLNGGRKDFGAHSPCSACGRDIKLGGTNGKKLYTRHIKKYKDPAHCQLLANQGRLINVTEEWASASQLVKTQSEFVCTPQFLTMTSERFSLKRKALATVLGWYLAEGTVDLYKRDKRGHLAGDGVRYSLGGHEGEYANQILEAWKTLGYKGHKYLYLKRGSLVVVIQGRYPAKLMNKLGGKLCDKKKLHPCVLSQGDEFLREMIRCFLLGDGGLEENEPSRVDGEQGVAVGITSRYLIWQLYMLMVKLGMSLSVPRCKEGSSKGVKNKRKDVWSVYIPARSYRELFEKEQRWRQDYHYFSFIDGGYLWRRININVRGKESKKEYKGYVYNLEVEGDESYICNGVAVHNCSGPEVCPFSQNCPYCQIGKPPLTRACLVEGNLLKQWVIELLREYEVDVESVTDRFLVQEMAEIELLLYRINSNLAQPEYAEMVKDSYANMDRQGNPVYEEKVIPLVELKLKLQGRRDKLVKLMVGDRQEKKKMQALLKEKDEGDVSTRGASLRRELERLQRETVKLNDKMTAEEGRIIEVIPIEEEKRLEEEEKQKRLEEIQGKRVVEEEMKKEEGLGRGDIFSAIDELEEEEKEEE